MEKVNLTRDMLEVKKVIKCGNFDITINEPNSEQVDKIIIIQESYYNEHQEYITRDLLIRKVIPLITNLDLDNEEDEVINKLFEHKPLWFKMLCTEIESIVLTVNRLKKQEIKNQIDDLENIVKSATTNIEISDEVKGFFKEKQDIILSTGDEEFIESAKVLNLIEVPEVDEKQKKIIQLEEELKRLKSEKSE